MAAAGLKACEPLWCLSTPMNPVRFRPLRPTPLSRHLILLVVGMLLPMVGLTTAVVLRLASHERQAMTRRLVHSARLLATTLDNAMWGTIRALKALAASEHLDDRSLEAFYGEARLVSQTQPSWLAVGLMSPSGEQLVNTTHPWGATLAAVTDPDSLRRVVESNAPVVGDLTTDRPGVGLSFAVRIPVVRDGALRYVLSAILTPQALTNIVASQLPPEEEWTRTIVDRQGTVVARTRDPERYVGQRSPKLFLGHIHDDMEDVYQDTTMESLGGEGVTGYVAFSRAAFSGWTAAVVVPVEAVEGPVRQSILAVAGVGLVVLLISGTGAVLLSRRLSRGFAAAAAAADALAHGAQPRVEPSAVAEVVRLGEALERSAELLGQRERERDEHLARAEAARAEAETASRAKDEFLAMLGHELRNPLSPIVTALELLELRGQAESREVVIIRRQVQHMVRLVDDLLDVSRITRGKVHLEKQAVEIAVVVARAVEMASPLLEQRQHALAVDVPAAGLEVYGDADRLAQVAANLLTNAARYTPPGGSIRVRGYVEDGEIVLSVRDNGQGLSAELLPRVFNLFVQGPRSADRQEGGLGVGLTLVRSLVAMHGGRVEAQSDGPGKGSTFLVRLPPLAQVQAARASTAEPVATLPRHSARAVRILLVDDNIDAVDLLTELFARNGHEVVSAHDGPAALAALERFTPEVAVLDIGLPVMDGYELAARIRDRLGRAAPAFVAVTGYGQEADQARSRAAGFSCHYVKPINLEALLAAVHQIANARAPERTEAP
jgi:signal transduction histidine kinase/ActR/RegA family two-component response regulator